LYNNVNIELHLQELVSLYCTIVTLITVLIQPEKQRVIRVLSVTTGDMLQRPAANRQL
jgi:hypothetical protein